MKSISCCMKTNLWLFKSFFLVAALCIFYTAGYAADTISSGFRVHLAYTDGKWSVGECGVVILPCEPPSKFIRGGKSDPLFKVIGEKEKDVISRHIRNPRRVLWEEPTKKPSVLEKTDFFLKFAFLPGMETLEYWEYPDKQEAPSLVVDLRKAVTTYWEKGGPDQDAPCKRTPDFFNTHKRP